MNWCFATVNSKLAEIYFEKDKSGDIQFLGHCYVIESEYKTVKEKRWIKVEKTKFNLTYRKGKYFDKTRSTIYIAKRVE